MEPAISIHIGLNQLDRSHYRDAAVLDGCENDARDMAGLAREAGFQARVLVGSAASVAAVMDAVIDAQENLTDRGILLVTFSGHGGRVPDLNDDESDGEDETWCLYDRQLLDEELYRLWAAFTPRQRIVVVADCCFSGGTAWLPQVRRKRIATPVRREVGGPATRLLRWRVGSRDFQTNAGIYVEIQRSHAGPRPAHPATVILLAACRETELALDGKRNGAFTDALLRAWRQGATRGTYVDFRDAIAERMHGDQHPVLATFPAPRPEFVRQHPFTVAAP